MAELAVQLAKFSARAAGKFPVQPTRSTANASAHHVGQRGKSLGRRPKLNPAQLVEAKVMHGNGRGMREIGEVLGVYASTVSRDLIRSKSRNPRASRDVAEWT